MLRGIVEGVGRLQVRTHQRKLAALEERRTERMVRFEELVTIVVRARHREEPLAHLAHAVLVAPHVFHVPEAPENREEPTRLADALAEVAGTKVRLLRF